ncbi:MAG: hypothetical protein P0Y59_18455 [Candidatus Sphingomonas phytovorans]|nr:hypothetical protein [Sphingomonas sp.]WEJ98906.1 MAG: hypothetical protein P0Y59_18455 [Sphingomonas sp.]
MHYDLGEVGFDLKALEEFDARNRAEGTSLWLKIVTGFRSQRRPCTAPRSATPARLIGAAIMIYGVLLALFGDRFPRLSVAG